MLKPGVTLLPHFCLGESSQTSLVLTEHLGVCSGSVVTSEHFSRGTVLHCSRVTARHTGTFFSWHSWGNTGVTVSQLSWEECNGLTCCGILIQTCLSVMEHSSVHFSTQTGRVRGLQTSFTVGSHF